MNPLSSLRARMTLGFTASFLGFVLVACLSDFLWSRHVERRDAARRVLSAARLIAHEWDGDTTPEGIERAIEYSREDAHRHGWRDALDDICLVVVDNTGRVLGANRHPHPPWPPASNSPWITATEPGRSGTVLAGVDGHLLDARLHAQALLLLSFGLLTTGVAGVAAWVLVGRTLRPIGALADQADTASDDPLSTRLLAPSEDAEVRHLVATLNHLLDRLSEDARAREQFYAAAAHELRTPLSVLSAGIEVALDRPRENAEYRETLTDLQDQTRRLIRLAEDLLILHRLDSPIPGGTAEDAEPIDLQELCKQVLRNLAPVIKARRLQIEFQGDVEEICIPPTHTAILIRNILDNAVQYASEGGRVFVTFLPTKEERVPGVSLRIKNDYPESAPLELDRWFEPFYRADSARSPIVQGNGLGLAICKRIAVANGWSLTLQREPEGVLAEVFFPFIPSG